MRLSGQGAGRSVLRGFFYAEQGLEAAELTLVGSLLTGQATTGVSLDRVNLYYQPPVEVETVSAGSVTEGGIQIFAGQASGGPRGVGSAELELNFVENDRLHEIGTRPVLTYLDFQPTNGGYPIRVSERPSLTSLGLPDHVIDGPEGVDDFINSIALSVGNLVGLELTFTNPSGVPVMLTMPDSAVALLRQQLSDALRDELAKAEGGGSTLPSSSLFGDISRFLPIEDRLRVVSWVER